MTANNFKILKPYICLEKKSLYPLNTDQTKTTLQFFFL